MYPASMLAYCSKNFSDESVKLDYRFAKKAEDHDHQWEDQRCKHIYHEMHEIHLDRHQLYSCSRLCRRRRPAKAEDNLRMRSRVKVHVGGCKCLAQ